MNVESNSKDILNGKLVPNIIAFAIPIALSSMLQQLFNAADTAVVGHFADSGALAAVGTNGEIVALIVSMSAGLAIGTNVILAKFIGEGRNDRISNAMHTSVVFAVLLGILGMIFGLIISRPLLVAINTPENILDMAVSYLRIYFFGYPFLMLYDFGSAILRSKGDSKRPFVALTSSGVLNVLLNVIFVIVFKWGVAGVAVATDISTAFSALLVIFWLCKEEGDYKLMAEKLGINIHVAKEILKIGLPAAIQSAVFCGANIFVQAAVNSFGEVATAGSTIAMNFEYFGYYMITAFGQTATTFVSQNYAAGNRKRCVKTMAICLICSVIFSAIITVPLTVWCGRASGVFSNEPEVISAACERILIILAVEPICGLYEVPAGVLRGMRHSVTPAVITVFGTCALRIGWIFTIFREYHTLKMLFISFPISWVVTIVSMWAAYKFIAE